MYTHLFIYIYIHICAYSLSIYITFGHRLLGWWSAPPMQQLGGQRNLSIWGGDQIERMKNAQVYWFAIDSDAIRAMCSDQLEAEALMIPYGDFLKYNATSIQFFFESWYLTLPRSLPLPIGKSPLAAGFCSWLPHTLSSMGDLKCCLTVPWIFAKYDPSSSTYIVDCVGWRCCFLFKQYFNLIWDEADIVSSMSWRFPIVCFLSTRILWAWFWRNLHEHFLWARWTWAASIVTEVVGLMDNIQLL